MKTKVKNRIINIFTFIVHFFISLAMIFMAYFVISWDNHFRSSDTHEFHFLIILIGIISFVANFFIFSGGNFIMYIIPISIAFFTMMLWVLIEGSMEVSALLLIYLVVFLPLVLYKYKLNNNS